MGVAMEMVHVTCGTSGGVFSFSVSRLSSRLSSSESSPGSHAARLLTAAFGFFAGSAAGFFFGGAGFFLGGAFFAGAFLGAGFGAEASLRGLPGPLFAGTCGDRPRVRLTVSLSGCILSNLLARTFFGLAAGFFAAGFFAAGLALVLAMALTFVAFAFGAAPRVARVEAGMFATTNFGSPKKINWLTG
jgi:hypothetical protein